MLLGFNKHHLNAHRATHADWEAVLAAPGNAAAAAAAAQKDSAVVKQFDATQTARDAAASVQGAVAGLLSGAGGRRLAAAGDGQVPARSPCT